MGFASCVVPGGWVVFSLYCLFWVLVSGSCLDVCGCCTGVTLRVDGFVIVCDWFGVVLCVVLLLSACFVGVIGLIWLLVLRCWWAVFVVGLRLSVGGCYCGYAVAGEGVGVGFVWCWRCCLFLVRFVCVL